MKYAAYNEYKTSDIGWILDFPAHWALKRLKYVANRAEIKVEADEDNPLPYIGLEQVEPWMGRLVNLDDDLVPTGVSNRFEAGDTLFGKLRPYLAKACNVDFDGLCSSELLVLRGKTYDRKFLLYQLLSHGFINLVDSSTYGSKMPRASWDFIGVCELPLPSFDEQQTIARFLDAKTAQIDALVIQKRQLITKLKEKRSALIARTVTSGLPPEATKAAGLEPNLEMKDSGVEWLGAIPGHWDIEKFSREVHIAEGQVDPEIEPFASMFLIAPNHIESGTGRLLALETAAEQFAESGKYLCPADAVVYSKIRPALRKVVIAPEQCLCSADMYPLTCKNKLLNPYLYWLLLSDQFSAWSVLEADRVAMPKINRETLNELRLPIPPQYEQLKIVEYLQTETAKVDRMLAKGDAAISSLTEYRQALITSAVTGKIDVRNLATPHGAS
ncbi:MAG: restriction endonuclease subunit S [Pseudomonas sp.]|nr:restriction endonuclease subunit S [Pseudomonas sp.]